MSSDSLAMPVSSEAGARDAAPSAHADLRGVLEAVAGFVIVTDVAGAIVSASRPVAEFAGLSGSALAGLDVSALDLWRRDADMPERLRAALAAAASGHTTHLRGGVVSARGDHRSMSLVIAPWRDGEGRLAGSVVSGADVVVEPSQNSPFVSQPPSETIELETIYRSAPIGLALFDRDLRVVRMNDALAEINGFTVEEHIGRQIWDLVPDLRAQGEPLLRHVLATGETLSDVPIEGETKRSPGVLRQWVEHFYPVRDAAGEIRGIGVICEEVTEKRRAEDALRNERNRLRAVLSGMAEGFAVLDFGFRILEVNAEALRIDGRPESEIVGRHLLDVWPEAEHMPTWPAYQKAMAERVPVAVEYRHTSDVHDVWLDVRAYPVDVGLAVFYRDVTDRRRTQSALEDLNAELEGRIARAVDERERALRLLHEAQKMEAIGQLTGGVAHDFNNLLSAVLANLTVARKIVGADQRALRLIDGAIQGAERGAALTRRLLAFARRQDLRSKSVDVPALVADMKELLQRTIGPAIVIDIRLEADLPPVSADPNQLELAVLNLAVNARDAMPEGGALTIAAFRDLVDFGSAFGLSPGCYVAIDVIDTGGGMAPDIVARATEPFFTTKDVGQGTGLGLSMVQGFAAQSGGGLAIESNVGAGTRVRLWLPCATEPPAIGEAGSDGPTAAQVRRKHTVLVVDDDALVRMGTAAILEDLGHTAIEVGSGAEALAALDAHPDVAIVVTDHGMPGMSGAELTRRLRAHRPDLPVIIATGYAELPNGEDVGAPRLDKPIRQDELAALLARLAG